MSTTIRSVAERAGVSPSTVSRVFTGVTEVSAEKREAVLKAAQELDFTPNFVARSLKLSHTDSIGLLVPDIHNPYFSQMARAIGTAARNLGYSVLLADANEDLQLEEEHLTWLFQRKVDGIIVATVGGREGHIAAISRDLPIVAVGRRLEEVSVDSVEADNYKAGYLAADHLLGLGHRKLGLICGNMRITSSRHRLAGFQARLKEENVPINENFVVSGPFSMEAGEALMQQLHQQEQQLPTALFCFNDQLAIGAMKRAATLGLDVPGQLSIIGCDDTYIARICSPELTTIHHPISQMGAAAVNLLVEKITKKRRKRKSITLPVSLTTRKSTAIVKERAHV